ncbi:MAG: hypothetical protein M1455_09475 [Actinobacteria bacterium]|nr:hypothetical protein [Actinomycetota bacterium]
MRYPTTIHRKLAELWRATASRPLPVLLLAGSVSLLAYTMFALVAFFIPNTDASHFPPYLALPESGFDLSHYYLLYVGICINALALFGFYLLALRSVSAGRGGPGNEIEENPETAKKPGVWSSRTNQIIFGFAVLFHVLMFLTPFLLSTDIFDYIRHGRIFAIYGENPLLVPATYFPQDPFFSMGGWVGTGAVYGSLHVYITGALAKLAGDGIGANLLLFKGFFIGMNLVNLALIWKIAARIRPGLERKAMVFYGWNPFVLALVVANAHNDILMLTFVLAGLLCYLDRRYMLGIACITLATLVKFIALPLLLVYVALAIRQQKGLSRKLAFGAAALGLPTLITVVSYLPLWAGRETFLYLTTIGQKTNYTISALLRDTAADHLQLSLSNTIVQGALAAVLLGYLIWHLVGVRNFTGLISGAAGLALMTPLALFWFQPWYLTLGLGLVALRPWRYMYVAALTFSFSVMFFDGFWWHAPVSMDIQKPLRVLIVFGPPLALLFFLKAREAGPAAWQRLVGWALEGSAAAQASRSDPALVPGAAQAGDPGAAAGKKGLAGLSDPSPAQLAVEIGVLMVAAIVPIAAVISSSPPLRSLVNLFAVKFRLLINL